MGNVMVIPARRQVGNSVKKSEQPKLRVAAYCRVSTDSDEQETSYDAQVTHYTEYIQKNPELELAGIFADDGISGTNTKKRTEFNRMIDECMAGNIDMIITKSISRFARNTLDCLQYIRQLKDKNIPVYFEKESINTMDAKGEVLITIMASLTQQESQSLSQNVKLGLQYR
ncbi:MAG TPA: recombinase family protein, partial [Lachnospiraceae bacterium]|nr:recombinase family protein [Lachnospiraceae bacterium]